MIFRAARSPVAPMSTIVVGAWAVASFGVRMVCCWTTLYLTFEIFIFVGGGVWREKEMSNCVSHW